MIFTPCADSMLRQALVGGVLAVGLSVGAVYYYSMPRYTRVGYTPAQPVAFSHELHAGKLGMSCIYCHSEVERTSVANVPNTQTCMNCHQTIKANSPALAAVRDSWQNGTPVHWKQVYRLPNYAYFNHSLHVTRGVGCVSCHGQVNEMPVVTHEKPLSMGWCLNCHRHPERNLRPADQVTNMAWKPEGNPEEVGKKLKDELNVFPPQSCQGCHR